MRRLRLQTTEFHPGARRPIVQRQCACGQHSAGGGECEECKKKNQLQRFGAGAAPESAAVEHAVSGLNPTSGQSLDSGTRGYMETRFGHDFSDVRVHTGPRAADSATSLNALAFTCDNQIVFNRGQYAPGTSNGRRLLAHELTHVVQNRGAGSAESAAPVSRPADPAEREASRTADQVARGEEVSVGEEPGAAIGRDTDPGIIAAGVAGAVVGLGAIGIGIAAALGAFKSKKKTQSPKEPAKEEKKAQQPAENLPIIPYEEALKVGAQALQPGFGSTCGVTGGQDPSDGYDAGEWQEDAAAGLRGQVIRSTTPSAFTAMAHLVANLGKDVPKAGGGRTRWKFDCFEAVQVLHLYATWRSMTREEFDKRFKRLEIGKESITNLEWKKPYLADNPKQKPYVEGPPDPTPGPGGVMDFHPKKLPANKSWKQILDEAPVGSQVVFSNQDATAKCARDNNLPFCAFMNENATKLGPDSYFAHPFGVTDRADIEQRMARAVLGDDAPLPQVQQYIRKNIYISGIRYPQDRPVMA
jgi:hypothetical protein